MRESTCVCVVCLCVCGWVYSYECICIWTQYVNICTLNHKWACVYRKPFPLNLGPCEPGQLLSDAVAQIKVFVFQCFALCFVVCCIVLQCVLQCDASVLECVVHCVSSVLQCECLGSFYQTLLSRSRYVRCSVLLGVLYCVLQCVCDVPGRPDHGRCVELVWVCGWVGVVCGYRLPWPCSCNNFLYQRRVLYYYIDMYNPYTFIIPWPPAPSSSSVYTCTTDVFLSSLGIPPHTWAYLRNTVLYLSVLCICV